MGCEKVIGICDTEEKCSFVTEELGVSAAINLTNQDVKARLKEIAPKGVNVYVDNCGGSLSDTIILQVWSPSETQHRYFNQSIINFGLNYVWMRGLQIEVMFSWQLCKGQHHSHYLSECAISSMILSSISVLSSINIIHIYVFIARSVSISLKPSLFLPDEEERTSGGMWSDIPV